MGALLTVLLVVVALAVLGILAMGVVGIIRKAMHKPERQFARVAQQASVLRQGAAQGLMTEAECKAQMRALIIAGTDGKWWMVGYKTGAWYADDGSGWAPANPPGFRPGAGGSGGR